MNRAGLAAAWLTLLLPACTSMPIQEDNCAALGRVELCLAGSGALPFTGLQSSVLQSGNTRETLILQLENDARGLRLAGFTPMGQTLLQAQQIDGHFQADGPAADKFDARILLATIQLAWWPLDRLRQTYQQRGLDVEESAPGVLPRERTLVREGETLLRIRYGKGHDVDMETTGLRLQVTTLEWLD